jgi:hypothetical protein
MYFFGGFSSMETGIRFQNGFDRNGNGRMFFEEQIHLAAKMENIGTSYND